ncbi:NH(3)-dependent NAD(+) synthetase [Krasilnikovia cinnamomea]|uniref:NH(3)-dependent NAD(+) synthetase n=1 Tax=Krasilnikovia cinnamomea TaxID=349313 RepID=A0A4Q7ZPD3_9ACTN|nr:ammonia-dependent NAD(+) synthetase [Krasilnikovia cinnamomea]RZU52922.1 NH(3)-dependent NAD(+) synthetase [Krasilnikovia cinnamomea]
MTPGQIARELGVDADFEADREIRRRVGFLAGTLTSTGAEALVLGISGGVDSTAAGRLCQLAVEDARRVGHDAVFVAMRLPYGSQHDEHDAQAALAFIRPDRTLTVDIRPASDASLQTLLAGGLPVRDPDAQDFLLGNIKARQRMIAQYALAAALRGLVVGTDHAAEAVTGFFTKHGDGAADVAPLTGLTKRRVRAIAEALGAPHALVHKIPTADLESLRPGRSDEEALGFTYDDIDDFLEGRPVRPDTAEAIAQRFRDTAHKRRLPAAPAASG